MDSAPGALIFDFDGVIADTEPLYWKAWREVLKRFGVPFTWQDYCRIGRGIRDEKILTCLAEFVGDPGDLLQIQQSLPEREEMVRRSRVDQPLIAKATVQLLRSLDGRILGLVTSSNRSDVEPLLQAAGIAGCFDACVFGEELTDHKPDPAPYILIREKLGIQDGVVFEDSEAGLLSATSAGFRAIYVASPVELPMLVRNMLESELA